MKARFERKICLKRNENKKNRYRFVVFNRKSQTFMART